MRDPLPSNVRQWGMWCHLAGLAWISFLILPIPYLSLLVPYLVWAKGRTIHPFIDEQGKEALNFQISISIYLTALLLLGFFLFFAICGVVISSPLDQTVLNTLFFGGALMGMAALALILLQTIASVVGAVRAANGQSYRYPLTLRFFR